MKIKTSNLDRLFSQYIRLKADYTCKACGKQDGLMDCAHIVSRRSTATRWLENNAVCLCRGCHMFYTERPHDWAEITEEWLGDKLQVVRMMAHKGPPVKDTQKEVLGLLFIEKIKAMGEKPVCGLGKKRRKK